jgi:hypothetical protein
MNEGNMYRGLKGAGKGDSPRNVSQKFKDNFQTINWGLPFTSYGEYAKEANIKKTKQIYKY